MKKPEVQSKRQTQAQQGLQQDGLLLHKEFEKDYYHSWHTLCVIEMWVKRGKSSGWLT